MWLPESAGGKLSRNACKGEWKDELPSWHRSFSEEPVILNDQISIWMPVPQPSDLQL